MKRTIPAVLAGIFLFLVSPVSARYYEASTGRFLQEDPILLPMPNPSLNLRPYFDGAESGSTQFYQYAYNSPLMYTDPTGFSPGDWWDPRTYYPGQEVGGLIDFLRYYRKMRKANTIGADSYFHCMANCQATKRGPGGADTAIVLGEGRELFDQHVKRDSIQACNSDRAANNLGQNAGTFITCRQACSILRPRGLPLVY